MEMVERPCQRGLESDRPWSLQVEIEILSGCLSQGRTPYHNYKCTSSDARAAALLGCCLEFSSQVEMVHPDSLPARH